MGNVKHRNPVAEKLAGWKTFDALGKPVEKVFVIEDEYTRFKVENPDQKVIRECRIAGLANHTILLSKDGMETSISDTGAPIKGKDGKILGTIIVLNY